LPWLGKATRLGKHRKMKEDWEKKDEIRMDEVALKRLQYKR
jgi:hypothetical protein